MSRIHGTKPYKQGQIVLERTLIPDPRIPGQKEEKKEKGEKEEKEEKEENEERWKFGRQQ